jgi:hypothetical protein
MWMQEVPEAPVSTVTGRPALAGGDLDAPAPRAGVEVYAVAAIFGVATLFFGIVPSPLFDLAVKVGSSLTSLF